MVDQGKALRTKTVKVCRLTSSGRRECAEIPTPVVYTMPGCGFCSQLLGVLQGNGIPYRKVVVNNQKAFNELVKVSGQAGAPVTVVGNRVVIGYDPKALQKALGLKKR